MRSGESEFLAMHQFTSWDGINVEFCSLVSASSCSHGWFVPSQVVFAGCSLTADREVSFASLTSKPCHALFLNNVRPTQGLEKWKKNFAPFFFQL